MATGIPSKELKKKEKIPVSLSYEGKENAEDILNYSGQEFDTKFSINGKGDNLLFFGDNIDVLSHLLHTK